MGGEKPAADRLGHELRYITYTDSLHTSRRTQCVSIRKTSQLMLYRGIMAVCSEIHTKHINTAVWAERRFLFI